MKNPIGFILLLGGLASCADAAGNPDAAAKTMEKPGVRAAREKEAGISEMKVYSVHSTDPAEIIELITVMTPDTNGLSIAAAGKKLVVRGTPEQHRIVKDILHDLNAPPKNVRIDVQFERSGRIIDKEAGIRPKGPIIIREGEGLSGAIEVTLRNQSTASRENVMQMLVAASGRSASLRVGETVPYLAWLHQYGHRWGYIREIGIEWRDVGAFLSMEPVILGNGLIRIRLIPELSGRLEDGSRETIRFTRVATEIIARDGVPVSIGGFSEHQDFYSKFLIGRSRGEKSSITDITLTPRILD